MVDWDTLGIAAGIVALVFSVFSQVEVARVRRILRQHIREQHEAGCRAVMPDGKCERKGNDV